MKSTTPPYALLHHSTLLQPFMLLDLERPYLHYRNTTLDPVHYLYDNPITSQVVPPPPPGPNAHTPPITTHGPSNPHPPNFRHNPTLPSRCRTIRRNCLNSLSPLHHISYNPSPRRPRHYQFSYRCTADRTWRQDRFGIRTGFRNRERRRTGRAWH